MKEWEKLEDDFAKEVQPLINEFIEYKNQGVSDFAKETSDIRTAIHSKTSQFINEYRAIIHKEIETKTKKVEKQRQEVFEEAKNLVQLKNKIEARQEAMKKAKGEEKGDMYQLLYLTQTEEIQKYNKRRQECKEKNDSYKSDLKQIDELKELLKKFEEKYGDIDYITEGDIYKLDILIGKKEEMKTVRMSASQVYDENGKVIDMENIMDMKQKTDEELKKEREGQLEQLRGKVSKMFDETQKEFDEYWEQKMREYDEVEAKVDEELKDEAEEKEAKIQDDDDNDKEKKNKGDSKKGKITLWQRFKSIFRKRNVPRLGEGKEQKQEVKPENKFESLKIGVPTEKQQAEHAKKFWSRNKGKTKTKEENELEEILAILD